MSRKTELTANKRRQVALSLKQLRPACCTDGQLYTDLMRHVTYCVHTFDMGQMHADVIAQAAMHRYNQGYPVSMHSSLDPASRLTKPQKRLYALAKELGFDVAFDDGEYRINRKGASERTAYYTDDLDDAIGTIQNWR